MNSHLIFKERRDQAWLHALQIIRLISSSSGTALLAGIALIFVYLTYQRLLDLLTTDHLLHLSIVLAVMATFLIHMGKVRSWLHTADTAFLLPMEGRMQGYIRACLQYSIGMQVIQLGIFFLLIYPFYLSFLGDHFLFFVSLLLIALLQAVHTYLSWYAHHFVETYLLYTLRFILSFLFCFVLFSKAWLFLLLTSIGLMILFGYYQKQAIKYPFPWHSLITEEEKIRRKYYAIASWFIDLPYIKKGIKPRKWLIRILQSTESLFKNHPFAFLYWRRFIRDDDYCGVYIRLVLVTALFMFIFPHSLFLLSIFALSLVLFAAQFSALGQPAQYPIWIRLYPSGTQRSSLSSIAFVLLQLQCVFLTVVATFLYPSIGFFILLLLSGTIFSYLYAYIYLKRINI